MDAGTQRASKSPPACVMLDYGSVRFLKHLMLDGLRVAVLV